MVVVLGVAGILDGLEITVASAVAAQRTSKQTLGNGAGSLLFLSAPRFGTGTGIGGGFAAAHSALDERIAFLSGPVLGVVIVFIRRHLPESPRWQVMHGHEAEAERTTDHIEHEVEAGSRELPRVADDRAVEIEPAESIGSLALRSLRDTG